MWSSEIAGSPGAPPGVRRVTDADVDRVAELFALAFYDDPTWSWAFPDPEQRIAANLAMIDELDLPAYLESSNRANDVRYGRLGFVEIGEFAAPGDGPTVGCMWRDPR